MPLLHIIFSSATSLLVIFTLLPLWRHESWWVRSLDFPRLQLLVLSTCLFAMEVVLLDLDQSLVWCLLLFTLFCFAYHSWWILPYTRLHPPEVASASSVDRRRTIRVMTAIGSCVGLSTICFTVTISACRAYVGSGDLALITSPFLPNWYTNPGAMTRKAD